MGGVLHFGWEWENLPADHGGDIPMKCWYQRLSIQQWVVEPYQKDLFGHQAHWVVGISCLWVNGRNSRYVEWKKNRGELRYVPRLHLNHFEGAEEVKCRREWRRKARNNAWQFISPVSSRPVARYGYPLMCGMRVRNTGICNSSLPRVRRAPVLGPKVNSSPFPSSRPPG